jgi:hypothetical protein
MPKADKFHKLGKFEKFKYRRGGPPGPHGMKKTVMSSKGVLTEMAEERTGEPARSEKAKALTRKMEKGYRKGYRVPKRPKRGAGDRKKNRNPYRKSSGR